MLFRSGVTLIGGSVEEMPLAYKDIDRVMYTQETLVEAVSYTHLRHIVGKQILDNIQFF